MLLCSFVPLALSLALLTLNFWTCYQYPYRFLHGDRNFLERWSFIFDRFHPKTYYFALILKLGSEKNITSGGICLCKQMDGEGFWFWKRDISTLANFSKPWCLHRSPGGFVHPTPENNHDSVFKLIRVFQWWFMRIRNRIYTGPYLLGMKMQFARHMDGLNPKSQDYSQYVDCCSSGSSVHPVGPATHPKSYMFGQISDLYPECSGNPLLICRIHRLRSRGKLDKLGLRTDIQYICTMFSWILKRMRLKHDLPTIYVDASPCNLVYSKKLF